MSERRLKKIVLTGGGTAGHVIPNLALLPSLLGEGWSVEYIGSVSGMEKGLVEKAGIPFHSIASGKLRRYFDLRNFVDPFRVLWGIAQAWRLLGRLRPHLVFSKGGFVAVPVVYAASLRGIPVLIHESDQSPGLANRLCLPFANVICVAFPETLRLLPAGKTVLTGAPIRAELLTGVRSRGLAFCGFAIPGPGAPAPLPVLLIMGGSLGSRALNHAVRRDLPQLRGSFQVVHICGRGALDPRWEGKDGYRQFEFVGPELPDVLAAADLVLSRAGANAIFEFLALRKPNLLVPLPMGASRGDQIHNARAFAALGYSRVLMEEQMIEDRLLMELKALTAGAEVYREAMGASPFRNGVEKIMEQIRLYQ